MKRLIAAVSLAFAASPVLAQSFDFGPTDPVMPAASYATSASATVAQADRALDLGPTDPIAADQVAGNQEVDQPIASTRYIRARVENSVGYFDPA